MKEIRNGVETQTPTSHYSIVTELEVLLQLLLAHQVSNSHSIQFYGTEDWWLSRLWKRNIKVALVDSFPRLF